MTEPEPAPQAAEGNSGPDRNPPRPVWEILLIVAALIAILVTCGGLVWGANRGDDTVPAAPGSLAGPP